MTDEPTDELEQRLRRDLGEIADAVPVDESPAVDTNVVPLTAATESRRRPVVAVAGVVGAAAALLIGLLIWQNDDDDPDEAVATQDPTTVPATTAPSPETTAPESTIPPVTTTPGAVPSPQCPSRLALDGASVRGETLFPWDGLIPSPAADFFGADEGDAESVRGVVFGGVQGPRGIFQASETFRVASAVPVRPVIDFVGERVVREGPILLWWAPEGRVEAWVSAEGCDTFGLSVTGGSRDQNASAAYELAGRVVTDAGLELTEALETECPNHLSKGPPTLFFYCPFDNIDQIPRPQEKFVDLSSPEQALRVLFATDPPPGWGTGIPLVMRGADVDVLVTDGVAQVTVDYDFEAAPINGFSTSAMSIAYGNQLQATLFQYPEILAIDLDSLCCGEWGGQVTRADWEAWLVQANDS